MEAATHVVEQDLALEPEQRRLLTMVGPEQTGEAEVRAQLVALMRRIVGETVGPDDEAIDDAYALFDAVAQRSGDPALAWKTTLAALLQDLRVVYY